MIRFAAKQNGDETPVADTPVHVDGALSVLFSGHLVNRAELIRTLRPAGGPHPPPDAALLALAWRHFNEALQDHVLGEYAAALYDATARRLVLLQDPLGVRPLFYAERGPHFVFGSHLDPVVALLEDTEIDERYIVDHLTRARHPLPSTPYRGVRRLLPGRLLIREHGRLSERRTWDLTRATVQPGTGDWQERFRALITEAVSAYTPTDQPVWGELSGGLDSSTLHAVAATLRLDNLAAFSVLYGRSPEADEREWMAQLLQRYPRDWITVDLDALKLLESPPRIFPTPSGALLFSDLLDRYEALAATRRVSVVLSGNGGDAVLMGEAPEPLFLADLLRRGRLFGLVRAAREWRDGQRGQRRALLHILRRAALEPALRYATHQAVTATTLPLAPDWLAPRLRSREPARDVRTVQPPARLGSVAGQQFAERVWSTVEAVADNLGHHSRSLDFRYPLLHRPLVELMFTAPWNEKVRPDVDRYLQRRALRGILPEAIRRRRGKRGPDQALFEAVERSEYLRDVLLDRPRIVARGWADGAAWKRTVALAAAGRCEVPSLFFRAVALELWLRQRE